MGNNIILFWIPSHVGIPGKDRADAAAKKALNNPNTDLNIPYPDFRYKITNYTSRTAGNPMEPRN